jgi:hypothetical protein
VYRARVFVQIHRAYVRNLPAGKRGRGGLVEAVAPPVLVHVADAETSFEFSQVRTTYLNSGTKLNSHYDLALAYLF